MNKGTQIVICGLSAALQKLGCITNHTVTAEWQNRTVHTEEEVKKNRSARGLRRKTGDVKD